MLLVLDNYRRKKTINLDNFDYIECISCGRWGFEVQAVRVEMTGNLHTSQLEHVTITIKHYNTKEEADDLYRKLQQAWINGEKVFFMND